jgi:hypothetical protein
MLAGKWCFSPVRQRVLLCERGNFAIVLMAGTDRKETTNSHMLAGNHIRVVFVQLLCEPPCPAMELSRLDQRQTPAWDIYLRHPTTNSRASMSMLSTRPSWRPLPPTTLPFSYDFFRHRGRETIRAFDPILIMDAHPPLFSSAQRPFTRHRRGRC